MDPRRATSAARFSCRGHGFDSGRVLLLQVLDNSAVAGAIQLTAGPALVGGDGQRVIGIDLFRRVHLVKNDEPRNAKSRGRN